MAVRDAGTTGTPAHPGRPDATNGRVTGLDLAVASEDEAFRFMLSLVAPDTASRAEDRAVRQAGLRLLWDAVEAAHELYVEHDRPGRERFGVTVTAAGQRIRLDVPSRPVSRGMASARQ
ncbi:hypothetical protein AB0D57_07225 [Streptomyces sp. NPDC048275]|uniref:hypothetical protein n=1 Tax=Streptomyces sp. NPDC048275 TaxID=3155629 RepID=UPI0033F5A7EC